MSSAHTKLAQIVQDELEKLTGQKRPLNRIVPPIAGELLSDPKRGIGHGQFNELLLDLGYDRVSHSFFQYLVDETTDYQSGASFQAVEHLQQAVDRFRKVAILLFGNVK